MQYFLQQYQMRSLEAFLVFNIFAKQYFNHLSIKVMPNVIQNHRGPLIAQVQATQGNTKIIAFLSCWQSYMLIMQYVFNSIIIIAKKHVFKWMLKKGLKRVDALLSSVRECSSVTVPQEQLWPDLLDHPKMQL